MDEAFCAKSFEQLRDVVAALVKECQRPEDAVAVASNLMFLAGELHSELAGKQGAAVQFYAYADRLAAEPPTRQASGA